jgi:hypothetical protein
MLDPITMIDQGGTMVIVVFLFGLLVFAAQIAQLVLAKKVDFVPLLWAGLVCTLLLGVLGTIMGITDALRAIASASEEIKGVLTATGVALSLANMMCAVLVSIPQAVLTGIVASRVRSARMSAG